MTSVTYIRDKSYESLYNSYKELEKLYEKYKNEANKLKDVEKIRAKKKVRRLRNKAKGPRK